MPQRMRYEKLEEINSLLLTPEEADKLLPAELYKYFSFNENLLKVLRYNALWFSSPNSFNDPFDCKVRIYFGKQRHELEKSLSMLLPPELFQRLISEGSIDTLLNDPKTFKTFFNMIMHGFFDIQLGVCCFSELFAHNLMWAHYANSHRGVCLRFHNRKRGFIHDNLVPVRYFKKYPRMDFTTVEEKKGMRSFLYQLIAAKGDDWDYEYEWRAFTEKGGNKTYEFDKENLTGVIFGINTDKAHKQAVRQVIQECNYPNVVFYQARPSADKYKILVGKC